jgi:large subunit ribosomal protein L13
MKTFVPQTPTYEERRWTFVDAEDKPLGRLAVSVANALRGKDTRTFDPSVDTGAFVVVTNASKVKLTGRKDEQKTYQTYSGYRGGQKTIAVATMRERPVEREVERTGAGALAPPAPSTECGPLAHPAVKPRMRVPERRELQMIAVSTNRISACIDGRYASRRRPLRVDPEHVFGLCR